MRLKKLIILFVVTTIGIAGAAGKAPVRLDIHLCGGAAYPWGYLGDNFKVTWLLDIDAKALVKKADAQGQIPRKYRGFFGDELYVGYMIIPNTLGFSINPQNNDWDGYIDWSIIGLTLLKAPLKGNMSAKAHFNLNAELIAAYHILKLDDVYFHSIRPGLQARADFYAMVTKNFSLKLSIFQNGYLPDTRSVDGSRVNIMPNYSGCVAGFVVHFYTTKKL